MHGYNQPARLALFPRKILSSRDGFISPTVQQQVVYALSEGAHCIPGWTPLHPLQRWILLSIASSICSNAHSLEFSHLCYWNTFRKKIQFDVEINFFI